MDQGPLVAEQIEAGTRFLASFQKYFPVVVALWLKESDTGEWYLHVVSDEITDENIDVAYGEVLPIAQSLHDPSFDPFQVKLLGTDDRLAQAALAVRRRFPGPAPVRIRDQVLGDLPVADGYVYPSPIPEPV